MTDNNQSSQSTQPIFTKRMRHGIATAVFEKLHEDRIVRSVNLQKSYRKGDTWERKTIYIDHDHIPFMIEALQATWDFLNQVPVGQTDLNE